MKKITNYKIIEKAYHGAHEFNWKNLKKSYNSSEMEKEIMTLISDGWEPLGGSVVTYKDGPGGQLVTFYAQTMIKYEETE